MHPEKPQSLLTGQRENHIIMYEHFVWWTLLHLLPKNKQNQFFLQDKAGLLIELFFQLNYVQWSHVSLIFFALKK